MKKALLLGSVLFLLISFGAIIFQTSNNYFKVLGESDHRIIRQVTTDQKVVALTFDDGPSPSTPKVLEILAKKNIPATFFVVGKEVEAHPDILKQTTAAGHEIGNHTNTHPFFWLASQEKISQEILIADEKIAQVLKFHPQWVRIPYGVYTPNVLAVTDLLKLPIISWNVDPEDWRARSADKIVKTVLKETEPGSIILLHDGPSEAKRDYTLEALPQIIDQFTQQGYRFVKVSELLSLESSPSAQSSFSPQITPQSTPTLKSAL
jgi:peptidoglycan/xylan/chitin deacetylase (PgdA/CDA1 family)